MAKSPKKYLDFWINFLVINLSLVTKQWLIFLKAKFWPPLGLVKVEVKIKNNKSLEKRENMSIRIKTLWKLSNCKLKDDFTSSCLILALFSDENIFLDR